MRIDLAWDERPEDPEPMCERCDTAISWCCCLPIVQCPQCGADHDDADGFGVLYCSDCGFCVCAVALNGRCDRCGKVERKSA